MLTMQHSLVSYIALNGNEKKFREEIPYILLADAIRRYIGKRQFSHFEEDVNGKDVAWIKFPTDLKNLTKDNASNLDMHIPENLSDSFLGETTHIESYEEHNTHLPDTEYFGIKKHLAQDVIFDIWIREQLGLVDYTQSKETVLEQLKNIRNIKGEQAKNIRSQITAIEEQGIYLLAYYCYIKFGVTTNQKWFDENVKKVIDEVYSQDLSDGTYNFMQINPTINDMISSHDWSKIDNGIISKEVYDALYAEAIKETASIECQKIKKLRILKS